MEHVAVIQAPRASGGTSSVAEQGVATGQDSMASVGFVLPASSRATMTQRQRENGVVSKSQMCHHPPGLQIVGQLGQ